MTFTEGNVKTTDFRDLVPQSFKPRIVPDPPSQEETEGRSKTTTVLENRKKPKHLGNEVRDRGRGPTQERDTNTETQS